MAVDFTKILSKPLDDVKAPKVWPEGTYYASIANYELGESKRKQTPQCKFNLNVHAFGEDIPPEAQDGIDLSKRVLDTTFYFTEASEYRLKQFLESCGIKTSGKTYDTTLPQTAGASVMLTLKHEYATDPQGQQDLTKPPRVVVDRIVGKA